ncbi:3-oxoacyl-[acyl-carrier-protein] reductase [Streptomyces sp. BK208]|uniref:3-oxoacyl-ACP reductase FabG n=1 Tax=Streptomyces sp. BK208 TaxID=2512150 RepID=UPI00105B7715|nr:3-oxoacyl-ACP reductase FabG [Streptomyces sp. BK208]TDT31632.1 3-oxoacyl-[acyl-carrier-protein] reductase [Streptomyces sp. BK208]
MTGRSVFVTGASRGIGLSIAQSFADQGDRVACGFRSGSPPQGFLGVRCDVTDAESVDAAFERIEREQGPVQVMVANAGVMRDRLALQMTEDDFTDLLDTNLTGAFRTARRAIPGMLENRGGRLIFISSFSGMMGSPGQANYAASKTGLVGLARSLARELGTRGITVNVVAPGFIDTAMTESVTPARRSELIALTALGRPGTPQEVASAVRFLASEDASYISGALVPVSGGLGMGV